MKNLILILILIAGISCTSKNKDKSTFKKIKGKTEVLNIQVNNLSNNKEIKLSEICDSIWYVRLESTKESMIGEMNKVIINDKYIIVADFSISKEVFIFDLNGKFITKISKLGKGPFEYSSIADVCYWPKTKSIFIFDRNSKKIIEYDITGKPVQEIPITFDAVNIALIDHDTFVLYAGFRENDELKYNLIYVNNKGEIIKKAFPIDKKILTKTSKNDQFYYFKNDLYFNQDYDNNIYCINKNSISYKYSLDFEKKNIPTELIFNKESDEIDKEISQNKYVSSDLQFESENYFFARLKSENKDFFQYIYSKKEKKGIVFYNPINDLPNGFSYPFFIGNVGDDFYSVIDSELLLMIKDDIKASKKKFPQNNNLINMFLNYKETDNPILCFCRINMSKDSK